MLSEAQRIFPATILPADLDTLAVETGFENGHLT